jgi:hypothetical protein
MSYTMTSQFISEPRLVNTRHTHAEWALPLRYMVGGAILLLMLYFTNRLTRNIIALGAPKRKTI